LYKLLACDLDETLLDDDKNISKKNSDAIQRARSLGVKFVITTGRGYIHVQDVLKELGLFDLENEYVISYNGGIITENKNNRVIDFHSLPYDAVHTLFEYGVKKDVGIHVSTTSAVYIYNLGDDEKIYLPGRMDDCNYLDDPDISFLKDAPLVKVLFHHTDIQFLKSIEDKVKKISPVPLYICYSSSRYLEMNKLGVTKGSAAMTLAGLLDIRPEEVIGIGDNDNDIPLVTAAGLGVSVRNGIPAIKEKAGYVCKSTNNESAIAEVLEKFIF